MILQHDNLKFINKNIYFFLSVNKKIGYFSIKKKNFTQKFVLDLEL